MGVRGLQGFVGASCPHVCTVVDFRELAEQHCSQHPDSRPTIVVDAMCCLRYWYTPESWVCGGQWREYFAALREFVKAFTTIGIKLVFFFDGMVEEHKRDEWIKRRLKNNREICKIFHYIRSRREQPGRNMFFIPSGLAIFTRFALKSLGQETLCSLREADYEVASYGLQNKCLGILGEDTDYLIYNTCPYFSISELNLDRLKTVMLCRNKLCESLGLELTDLPLLSCLLGNDVVPEGMFESFRYKCLSVYTSGKQQHGDKRGNVILAVADHIAKVLRSCQGKKRLEDILPLGPNRALVYKGMALYLLPGQKSPWFIQKSRGMITLDKQVVSMNPDSDSQQEITLGTDPTSKQEVPLSTDPTSKQEVPLSTDAESKQEVPLSTDPASKQEVPLSTDPASKQEVPLSTDAESKQEVPLSTDAASKQEVPLSTDAASKQEVPLSTDAESKQEVPLCTDAASKQEVPLSTDPASKQEVRLSTDPASKQEVPLSTDAESKQEIAMCTDPAMKQEVPLSTDPESKQDMLMCTDSDSEQEIPMNTDPESKADVPMCADLGPKQQVLMCAGPGPEQEIPMCGEPSSVQNLPIDTDPESELEAQMTPDDFMGIDPEIKQQTLVSDPEILEIAKTHHVQSDTYLVYSIMTVGEIECSNTLEDAQDQALPSQAFVFRPVRQRVYSLLLGSNTDDTTIKEWFVYAGNPLKQPDLVRPLPMSIPGGMPSLRVLWLDHGPRVEAQRLDTLLACFDLFSAREELQAVEGPFQALCCLLIYLFVQVDTLCLEDLHAFIAQALCLPGKSTAQLEDLELDYIDARAVQLGALLVRGLTTLVLVNGACGSPWMVSDLMPWNVFDGKLFHQKYLQAEKGYSVEALVEQNRSRFTRFQALKSAVCRACALENRRISSRQPWRSHHTGRWGRQESSSYRMQSRSGTGQPWREQGSRQYEPDPWRRHSGSSSGWSN